MKHNISKLNTLIKDANEIIYHIKANELEERVKIAISFFELFIQNNKSMFLLIEGGFYNEALAIHRLSIEHFFNIFSLIKKRLFRYNKKFVFYRIRKNNENTWCRLRT